MREKLITAILVAALLVLCGCGNNVEWFPKISTAPVANAGPAQSVVTGTTVTLDGSASSDANGDKLTYSWAFSSVPSGSSAALSNATTVNPTFVPDKDGTYVVSLTVSDGLFTSSAATVTITAASGNAAPVANAGTAQSVVTGATVTLDGSASSDANGDSLTYSWSFSSVPNGSTAALSSATLVNPTFVADIDGTYVVSLTVNDGTLSSAAATVTITAAVNAAPVANAGPAQSVVVGTTVTLDGSASSDANGDQLTYSWFFSSVPSGSTAVLSNDTTVSPAFVPDKDGTYVVSLTVNDGTLSSAAATVSISVIPNSGSITVSW